MVYDTNSVVGFQWTMIVTWVRYLYNIYIHTTIEPKTKVKQLFRGVKMLTRISV